MVAFIIAFSLSVVALISFTTSFKGTNYQALQLERPEVVLINLLPSGFDQRNVALTGKRFLFAIDNRSGLEEVSFVLNLSSGQAVNGKRLVGGKIKWRQLVDLSPGKYTLTVAGHPEWMCDLKIFN